MRIERLTATRYGRLTDWDTGAEPLPNLVVFLGPNESGKSTLFDCLCSVFFGFSPATRDAHPYAPWDGTSPEISATLRLDDGVRLEVFRKLLSSPRGETVEGETRTDLGNRTLGPLQWIPRSLFRHVYALRLDEFGVLGGKQWDGVKDRLLGGNASTDLGSPRRAVEALIGEAHAQWRPDRRGRSEARRRNEELEDLLTLRAGAIEDERGLRAHATERDQVEAELEGLKESHAELEAALEQAAELNALSVRIQRLREFERAAGDLRELEGLSPTALSDRERLAQDEKELARELEFLAAEAEAATQILRSGPAEDDPIFRHVDAIRAVLGQRERIARDREEMGRLVTAIQTAESALGERVPEFFEGTWKELDPLSVARIPAEELRAAVRRSLEAEAQVGKAEASLRPEQEAAGGESTRRARLRIAAAVLAVALGVFLLLLPAPWAGGAGGVFVLIGAGLLAQPWLARIDLEPRERTPIGADPARALEEAHSALVTAQSELRELVGSLPLRAHQLESPDPDLAGELRRIRNSFADRRTAMERRHAMESEVQAIEGEIRGLAEACGVGDGPPGTLLDRLEGHLEDARTRKNSAAAAEQQLSVLERKRTRVSGKLDEVSEKLRTLDARAQTEGDPTAGLKVLTDRIESARQATQRREELEREGIDPAEVEARVARMSESGSELLGDPEAVSRGRARWRQIKGDINSLAERYGRLSRAVDGPRATRTLADVEGEVEATREAIRTAEEEHDRLLVVATLIREADRAFREAHQPDVVRRAGEHLSVITGGRYDRLYAEDGGDRDQFLVRGAAAPGSVDVDGSLSTGTREQIYLALRLAAIDHLDEGSERLPLIFDETFANWDAARRARSFTLLEAISERRQLLLFTCHPELAQGVEDAGGKVISLADPE